MPNRTLTRALIALALVAMLSAGLARPVHAEGPAGPSDPQELEAFFDGLLTAELKARHLPGATLAVVKDGELFFSKGYGYADLETRTPVDPARTLFATGSVSKLFTWTAVMQLVEAGKLDLDADVNTYLEGFQIPPTYPQPITLAHLMAHTPGFEDEGLGVFVAAPEDLVPLGEYLAARMPARVRPPGELSAYSNYGTALAGYIVEQVSGEPFEQYVEAHILQPLGMEHSTFRQPLPPELAAHLATGYTYAGGAQQAGAAEWCQPAPAGALRASADDMAAFMIAHLQGGRYGDTRILGEASARRMHEQHFAHDPQVSGFAHGFIELHLNGRRLLAHGGDTILFHSLLALLPEEGVGLYLSFNGMGEGPGAGAARNEILQAFLDRYYPAPRPAAPTPPADFSARAGQFAGQYLAARGNWTTVEKLMGLLQQISVRATPQGTLLVTGAEPQPSHWVEVAPLVFRNVDSADTLVFRADAQGRIVQMFPGNNPTTAYLKLPWYAGTSFNMALVGACLLLFLSMLVLPAGLWLTRPKPTPAQPSPRRTRLARGLAWAMALVNIAFLPGLVSATNTLPKAPYGVPPSLQALLALPLLGAALALAVAACAGVAWARRDWGVLGRVHYTLVALAGLAFVWWTAYWNLLGFRF